MENATAGTYFSAMVIGRLQEFAKGVRDQQRSARRWAQQAPAGKLKLEFWSGPEAQDESKLGSGPKAAGREDQGQVWPPEADAELASSCESAGTSVWEGVIPDPVGPSEPTEPAERGERGQPVDPGELGRQP